MTRTLALPAAGAPRSSAKTSAAMRPRPVLRGLAARPDAGTVLSVGVLPAGGQARFTLPASVLDRYQAIDVSLEADDGDPTHSKRSLLRGRYA
jgi:Anti-sigma-K factor rskA